jgi:acetolactate synthase-1/2/3 large subunit
MGVAVPGCISASLHSDSNVVAVSGDGGFMMNMQELETAKRIGVTPTIIVLDDGEYTAISMEQSNDYGEFYGSSFNNPDFVELAQSFGIKGYEVTSDIQLESTLEKAVSSNEINLVRIPIDPSESYELDNTMR